MNYVSKALVKIMMTYDVNVCLEKMSIVSKQEPIL